MATRIWRLVQAGCILQLLLLLGLAISCQGQGPLANPTPGASSGDPFPAAIPPGLVLEDTASDGTVTGAGVLGAYRFILDPATQTARLDPIQRSGDALGDPYSLDITGFLAGTPCNDCFKVKAIGKTPDNYVYADYELRHPFPLPTNNPPQFGDRLDLHVFDVRGIFLKPDPHDTRGITHFADLASAGNGPQPLAIDNSGFLAGITIDGTTTEFDAYTDSFFPTMATAHPFVMMHTDTRPTNFDAGHPNGWTDLDDPIGHNVFPQGGGPYTQRVVFTAEPGQTVEYLIVLAANFASPAQGNGLAPGKRGNPAYYLPWANMKSPWRVKVEETLNTLEAGNATSEVRLKVTINDWQHHLGQLTIVDEFRAENQSRNSLLRPSRVLGIDGEVPGVSPMSDVNSGFLAGVGTPQDPLIYEVVLHNSLRAEDGTYLGALAIRDEYEPGDNPEGLGRDLTPFVLQDFTTYVPFSIQVAPAAGGGTTFGGQSVVYQNSTGPQPNSQEHVNIDPHTAGNLAIFSTSNFANELLFGVAELQGFNASALHDTRLAFCPSTNGGTSFGQAQLFAKVNSGAEQRSPEVVVAEDTFAPGVPWIHVAWVEERNGNARVYYMRSNNLGTSWSTPVQAHGDGTGVHDHPSIAVSPFNSQDVYIAMEERLGGSSLLVARDSNGDGLFDQEQPVDVTMASTLTNRRLTPHLVFPPVTSGEPSTMGMAWVRVNSTGPDVVAIKSTTGLPGLAGTALGVSSESILERSIEPFALFAMAPAGLDLLVAYNTQKLLTVVNPVGGGSSTTIAESRVMVGRKPAFAGVFNPPVQVSDTNDVTSASQPTMVRSNDNLGHAVAIVWHDNRNRFTSGSDLFASFSANNGVTWTPDQLLVGAMGNQKYPTIVVNRFGQFRVLYRDENRAARESVQLLKFENG